MAQEQKLGALPIRSLSAGLSAIGLHGSGHLLRPQQTRSGCAKPRAHSPSLGAGKHQAVGRQISKPELVS